MSNWGWYVKAPGVPVVTEGEQPLSLESLEFLTSDEPPPPPLPQEGGTDGR